MVKKNALHLSVNVFSTKVLTGDTFLRLLLETGPPFYEVIRAKRRYSRKEVPSFLSYFKTPSLGPAPTIDPPRPPALQSSGLPTELIVPQILHLSGNRNGQAI